jgi:hypothetical protein
MENNRLIVKKSINANIKIASNLIVELKKYLDVRYLETMLAELEPYSGKVYIIKFDKLNKINAELLSLIKYIQYSIKLQQSDYNFFGKIRNNKPETIDAIIKTINPADWHGYMCNQAKLIGCILAFCNAATENKVKIFNFFKDDNFEHNGVK